MIYRLVVPGPVEDVEEVRVLEWHGAPGHVFAADELIVELETHKAIVEVRGARAGVLRAILCEAGEWRALGEPLALLSDTADEPVPAVVDARDEWQVEFEIT